MLLGSVGIAGMYVETNTPRSVDSGLNPLDPGYDPVSTLYISSALLTCSRSLIRLASLDRLFMDVYDVTPIAVRTAMIVDTTSISINVKPRFFILIADSARNPIREMDSLR